MGHMSTDSLNQQGPDAGAGLYWVAEGDVTQVYYLTGGRVT